MQLADLLRETFAVDSQDVSKTVRQFGVRLHTAGLSMRETVAVLELLGVQRSHGAVWQWVHRLGDSDADPLTAKPSRVGINETAVKLGTEWYWLYAAVDLDSLYLLDIAVFSRYDTDPAAASLHKLTENCDVSETEFVVDAYGYRTALAQLGLSGLVEYSD